MARTRRSKRERAASKRRPKGRELAGVPVLTRLPPAPSTMPDDAREQYGRLGRLAIELGTLTKFDLPLLELAARIVAAIAQLEDVLVREGLTTEAGSGGVKAHPALAALDRARSLAHRYLTDLGLAPPGRERLSIETPAVVEDRGAEYFT